MPDILRSLSAASTKMFFTHAMNLLCVQDLVLFVCGTNAEDTVDKPNTHNGNEYTWKLW